MTAPITITDATFVNDVLLSEKPVLVEFWATWCEPCKLLSPILDEIASEHDDKIVIAKIEVDTNGIIPRDYEIRSVPTMILFQGGIPVMQILGAKPKEDLLADLNEILNVGLAATPAA